MPEDHKKIETEILPEDELKKVNGGRIPGRHSGPSVNCKFCGVKIYREDDLEGYQSQVCFACRCLEPSQRSYSNPEE